MKHAGTPCSGGRAKLVSWDGSPQRVRPMRRTKAACAASWLMRRRIEIHPLENPGLRPMRSLAVGVKFPAYRAPAMEPTAGRPARARSSQESPPGLLRVGHMGRPRLDEAARLLPTNSIWMDHAA